MSLRDFEIFLHLSQYKVSSHISQLCHMVEGCYYVHQIKIYKIEEYRPA